MPTLDLGGAFVAFTDTGPPPGCPDAPVILFGHGLLFGGWMFGPQVAALRGRYRCVTLDWRGQGDSAVTASGYDMDTLTADALAVVAELGLGRVHYVGLSMGGFVGLRLAARHGDALRSLTLLNTSADAEEPDRAAEYRRLSAVQRLTGIRPLLSRIQPHLFSATFRADPRSRAVIADWADRLRGRERRAVTRAVAGVAARKAMSDELGRIGVPTLIVTGDEDEATPPVRGRRIAAGIRDSRIHLLTGCGHSSTLEQPGEVSRLLAGFLATQNP